ncbi:MAG: hypothetical protein AAF331_09145 [Pseudomonadota bacterium]
MKKTATHTLLAAAFAFGTVGLIAPAIAQEAEAPVEMTDEELDAVMEELLDAELDACADDEACIDAVLDEYEADLDISEGDVAPEADMEASSAAEGAASAAAAPAQAATDAAEAVAPAQAASAPEAPEAADEEGVLNSAGEADEDSDGTGGTTRPGSRPDRQSNDG